MAHSRTPLYTLGGLLIAWAVLLPIPANASMGIPDICGQATVHSVQNGLWSNATTWANKKVPGANDIVLVGNNVTINSKAVAQHICVEGQLIFQPTVDTALSVDTLLVDMDGKLVIGTPQQPVAVGHTATITFTDNAPINTTWDPYKVTRGLISMGTVTIQGAAVAPYATLTGAAKGSKTLYLTSNPTGWHVGDHLVLPSTSGDTRQNEELTILAIAGDAISIQPLLYDHESPDSSLPIYVANLTRNVVLQSANPTDIAGHGHTMYMSNLTNIANAAFMYLGRTNKAVPINDPVVVDGVLQAGTGTNPRARYACHFHRIGVDKTKLPQEAVVTGSVVVGSPGWGFDNHGSWVNYARNVSYKVAGAGFVAEEGDEIGEFTGNLAIYSYNASDTNPRNGEDERRNVQDFGFMGDGFWFQGGGGLNVQNNIATDSTDTGFAFYAKGLIQNGVTTTFLAANLPNPAWANGAATVAVNTVPVTMFKNNTAYSNPFMGVDIEYNVPLRNSGERSLFDHITAWNSDEAVRVLYSSYLTVQNSWINSGGCGICDGNEAVTDNIYRNNRIEGFVTGIATVQAGEETITGGNYDNLNDINIPATYRGPQVVTIDKTGLTFVSGLPSKFQGRGPRYNITETINFPSLLKGYGPASVLSRTTITYGNQQVYAPEQDASYIPFPSSTTPTTFPAAILDKTNQQLWNNYGVAVGDAITPPGTTSMNGVRGSVGPLTNYPADFALISPQSADHTKPYILGYAIYTPSYYNGNRQIVTERNNPTTLQPGWNILTRMITLPAANGTSTQVKTSFFVFGQ